MEPVGKIAKRQFTGFFRPTTTPTPDELFDRFMRELTHAELKVVLYVTRRTFGFRKARDRISLKQIAEGIVTRSGKRLDHGAGVSRRTAITAVKSLETKGLITVKRVRTDDGFNRVNTYSLRFREG